MPNASIILTSIVATVGFGIAAQVLAHRWRIPAIVILLLSGILLGPSVLGLVHPESLGDGLGIIVKLAVAIILFDGALNLRLTALRNSAVEIRNLVTIGALVTWVLVSLVARFVAQLSWPLAILFGALMTVTGPTVVQPLLKKLNISKNIKIILEGEAILIDPIGAILAVAVLDVILASYSAGGHDVGLLGALWGYFGRLVTGLVVGGLAARLLSWLMKLPRLIPSEISNLVALAMVWASFGIAEHLQSESGIMASVAMGLMLQREAIPAERQLRHFKESLTTLSISILFVLLAANLDVRVIYAEGWRGIVTVLLMMVVVRPLAVFISTYKTKLKWREKLFISWIGPRGIVAASAASLFAVTLQGVQIDGRERILSLTFLVIILTVTLQSLTADAVSRLLKINVLEGKKTIIVGASKIACKIAHLLAQNGRPVTIIDTNRAAVEDLKRSGCYGIHGNALDEAVLEKAGIDETETLLTITSNAEVNVLIAQLAYFEFGISRAYPSVKDLTKGVGINLLAQSGGKLAFGRTVDLAEWENNIRKVKPLDWVVPAGWASRPVNSLEFHAELLPIIRKRKGNVTLVHSDDTWQPDDIIVFLTTLPLSRAQKELGYQLEYTTAQNSLT